MTEFEIIKMSCDNPYCDNLVETSRNEKIKLNTEDPVKGRLKFVYCCKTCRETHLKALTGKG